MKRFLILISIFFSVIAFSSNLLDKLMLLINKRSMSYQNKVARIKKICLEAKKIKYSKVILISADYSLKNRDYKRAKKYYRLAAKIGIIKKNYLVIYACGVRLIYLSDKDEGASLLYIAARRAMWNSDWFFIVRVARELVKIKRYKASAMWLERAGYFARRRKSISGLQMVSSVYKEMGYKYAHKSEYWLQAARNVAAGR